MLRNCGQTNQMVSDFELIKPSKVQQFCVFSPRSPETVIKLSREVSFTIRLATGVFFLKSYLPYLIAIIVPISYKSFYMNKVEYKRFIGLELQLNHLKYVAIQFHKNCRKSKEKLYFEKFIFWKSSRPEFRLRPGLSHPCF